MDPHRSLIEGSVTLLLSSSSKEHEGEKEDTKNA
jgi:hypothetical protein